MAIQSSFYSGTALDSRTFPSTKHIATKQHMAVWKQQVADNAWVQVDITDYQLINNACVLNQLISQILYTQLEVRVADDLNELVQSPSDISVVAGIADEVITVAGISNAIQSLYTDKATLDSLYADKAALDSLYADKDTLDSLYADKVTLDSLYADKVTLDSLYADKAALDSLFADKATLDSLYADKDTLDSLYADKTALDSLYADKTALDSLYANLADINTVATNITDVQNAEANANTAKLKAWEAEAEKLTADSYATELENTFVKRYSSNGDGTFIETTTNEYSSLHYSKKSEAAQATVETTASNVLLSGNLALEDYAVTKNFATVLYTGNGDTQDITTGISSVDFTTSGNGSGYWLDRDTFEVKTDAGDVVASGECIVNTSKVHYKCRSQDYSNFVFDGLRGIAELKTDTQDAEGTLTDGLTAFTQSGITLGSHDGSNTDTETYVLYQTLYTHIKWGTTNQNKKYVEAFNPVTRETMVMYEGSGNAGHEIPHSLGVELDYFVIKRLTGANDWIVNSTAISRTGILNYKDKAELARQGQYCDTWSSTMVSLYTEEHVNLSADAYILYGKAKSENWTIVEYTGTGAAGNFVETKDVYGVAREPARVTTKCISDTGSWYFNDNKRGDEYLLLNTADAATAYNQIDINLNGFTIQATGVGSNGANGQYIALVEFDTNSNGGDGYFNMPTDDSNLNLTDGVFSYTDGKDSNGYVRSTESLAGTTTIDFAGVSDGYKYCYKVKGGGYGFTDTEPKFVGTSSTGDGHYFSMSDGKWYDASNVVGGQLSYFAKVMVVSETPMYLA